MELLWKNLSRFLAPTIFKLIKLDIWGNYNWLQKTMKWTTNQRAEWKLKRLNEILEFSWSHVPFYREYWGDHSLSFKPLRSLEEIESYPILTKKTFKANSNKTKPDNLHIIRYKHNSTGGTTGSPVHYLQDLDQWVFSQAFHLWGWSQTGYKFGDPVGVIAGGSLVPEKLTFKDQVRNFLERKIFLFGVHLDRHLAIDYFNTLQKNKVKYLYGYPSIMYLFSKLLSEENLTFTGLNAVVTTAEMLQPHYKIAIESIFNCPVFNNLGCNDGGFESYECSLHNGFHYNDLQSILELQKDDSNTMARLIITNLWNKSTPFIRYENGDYISLSDEPCPCGQPFPLIKSIDGRTTDILTFSNGRHLAGPALTLIFRDMEIDGWQVVQKAMDRVEVRIASSNPIEKKDFSKIQSIFSYHLTEDIYVDIKHVEKLDTTKGGKLKPVWSEIPNRKE